ncbi:hypothetical protein G6F31_018622 [Rhizopus arrhizus]|nr:hypothetical protein G6F31_018622 [Rhizopus arrhizus]
MACLIEPFQVSELGSASAGVLSNVLVQRGDVVKKGQVVAELNRYRRGRLGLMHDQLGRRLVQARFSLAQVADAERLIRDAYGAHVTRLPAGVVLLS